MSNGEKSDTPWYGAAGKLIRVEPPGSVINKIVVCYKKDCITYGVKMFAKNGTCVLKAGIFSHETTEIEL